MTPSDRRFMLSAGALTALLLVGVEAQKLEVKTNQDPKADFTSIKTYAWLPPAPMVKPTETDAVRNPSLNQEVLGPHIVAAIDRQLAARGLTQTDRDSADVHVVYFAAITVGFQQTYLGEYYGYVTGWASPLALGYTPSTSSTVYEKGTVVVDMVHRASNRAIWRGSVVTRIHQENTLDKRIARINDGAERMFKKFPIRSKK